MQSSIFIYIVESEYQTMLTEAKGEWKSNGGTVTTLMRSIPSGRVERFKEWFRTAMRTVSLNTGDFPADTTDVIMHAAQQRANIPPFELLHPKIYRTLALFDEEDLDEIFGVENRSHLKTILSRI